MIRNALRRERIFRPRLDVLSFPEEYLFQRYRFSSNSIIYLNNILRPYITRYRFTSQSIIYIRNLIRPYMCNITNRTINHTHSTITNLTHRRRALTSEQTLCIALHFFAIGSFRYNIGDAEHYGKAAVCRAVRKVTLALTRLLPVMVVFPGHKPVRNTKEEFHRIAGGD
ncbi:putative nuclease HARBI1 [Merluccius polli]|uniref:Nuclease HARBI1 n=1 Tax=Merluccius polli TaxID=89951 RepID=A0AA47M2P4_MERPO|nr:putative nuclease HARBI1 [Merluccius polli]